MKIFILLLAKYSGLFYLSSRFSKQYLRILGYHGIWFTTGHFGNHLFMRTNTFAQRMAWLKKSKYHVLPLSNALRLLYNGHLPKDAVVITIDDGWYGTYKHMLPILIQNELPATIYVYSGAVETQLPVANVAIQVLCQNATKDRVSLSAEEAGLALEISLAKPKDKERAADTLRRLIEDWEPMKKQAFCELLSDRMKSPFEEIMSSRQLHNMTFEEIAEADRLGIDIQLHSHTHQLSVEVPEKIVSEIRVNKDKLIPFVTRKLEHFCYPNGVFSEDMFPYLEHEGISSATTVESGLNSKDSNRFKLKRILDGEEVTQLEIEAELSGFIEFTRRIRRFVRLLVPA